MSGIRTLRNKMKNSPRHVSSGHAKARGRDAMAKHLMDMVDAGQLTFEVAMAEITRVRSFSPRAAFRRCGVIKRLIIGGRQAGDPVYLHPTKGYRVRSHAPRGWPKGAVAI